jgi:nucleolar protein 56
LREWYSIHFPELDQIVQKHDLYARIVSAAGERSGIGTVKAGLDRDFEAKIKAAADDSLGASFNEKDVAAVKSIADASISLTKIRDGIESYIESSMKEIAPNTAELVGGLLGARLIARAGGIKKLALMPASTVQVLGAEDAFFRFLKTRKKPPKHGIIFQHPDVRSAPNETRGKIARALAAKIAIAAKSDAFKGSFIGGKLREDFQKRVASLKK